MKPKQTKPKPAAIVVGRNLDGDIYACPGRDGEIRDRGFYANGSTNSEIICDAAVKELHLPQLGIGQYIRFVQDGGVRKARRVKS